MTTQVVADEKLGAFARRQNDLFRRVREGSIPFDQAFAGLQDLIEGNFGAIPVGPRRVIDCDATPYIPEAWKVEEHRKGGEMEFDPMKVVFHLDEDQKNGRTIVGNELRKRLAGKSVMNACVLDHLLANTNLIPEAWKANEDGSTRYIYFWGTVYRDSVGNLFVRYLYWHDGRWRWDCFWLGGEFSEQSPAAVSAS